MLASSFEEPLGVGEGGVFMSAKCAEVAASCALFRTLEISNVLLKGKSPLL